jgi:hypothetical protein
MLIGYLTLLSFAQQPTAGDQRNASGDKPTKEERVSIAVAADAIAIGAAILSGIYFLKNRSLSQQIADRTVTIEAQKFLLEVNKQYVSNPELFAIYDSYPNREQLFRSNPELLEKVKALGYLKLNVFEIVYSVLPEGGAWKAYFEDSLQKCSILREELEANEKIYDKNLIAAYSSWKRKILPTVSAQRAPSPTS